MLVCACVCLCACPECVERSGRSGPLGSGMAGHKWNGGVCRWGRLADEDMGLRCRTDFVPSFLFFSFFFFSFPGNPHGFPTDEVENKVPCNKSKLK